MPVLYRNETDGRWAECGQAHSQALVRPGRAIHVEYHMLMRFLVPALAVAMVLSAAAQRQSDVLVYGCTSGAVTAAIQAKRMGKSVVMVCPETHLGGLSREFYHRVWQRYDNVAAWTWQKREEFGNEGQGTPAAHPT